MLKPSLNDQIRAEADRILDSGLRTLLAEAGDVHVVGSYALGLMTWRDLDIHVVQASPDVEAFFGLGGRIAALLRPHRMHFRDESTVRTPGLPRGFYWGVYFTEDHQEEWKIDIWQTDPAGLASVLRFSDKVEGRLTATNREAILAIKQVCWRHPEYRRGFTSADVYSAVLDRGVRDIDGFWIDLREQKGIVSRGP